MLPADLVSALDPIGIRVFVENSKLLVFDNRLIYRSNVRQIGNPSGCECYVTMPTSVLDLHRTFESPKRRQCCSVSVIERTEQYAN